MMTPDGIDSAEEGHQGDSSNYSGASESPLKERSQNSSLNERCIPHMTPFKSQARNAFFFRFYLTRNLPHFLVESVGRRNQRVRPGWLTLYKWYRMVLESNFSSFDREEHSVLVELAKSEESGSARTVFMHI